MKVECLRNTISTFEIVAVPFRKQIEREYEVQIIGFKKVNCYWTFESRMCLVRFDCLNTAW